MIFDEYDLAGAVFLFSEDKEIIREMNYAEFQALQDGYVPAVDLANRELNAAYVEINANYLVRNAVFFLVRFNTQGFADAESALPLFELAQGAADGPDLGAGPIGLACASQCHIDSVQQYLWEPSFSGAKTEFNAIRDAARRNKIAILFRDAGPERKRQDADDQQSRAMIEQAMQKRFERELQERLDSAVLEERRRITAQLEERELLLARTKEDYEDRLREYRTMLDEHKTLLSESRERNTALKETIDGQAEKIQGLREYFELKLEQAESAENEQLAELRENREAEISAAVDVATKQLKELLQMREVESVYRNEQEARLHEELTQLREQHRVQEDDVDSEEVLLLSMLEKGISFVSYQPGAGHITLPVSDISRYMENPAAYVAEHCGVTEEHYSAWLEHYHVPVCQAVDARGEICGDNINRVETPSDFKIGESDCCYRHRKTTAPVLKLAGSKSA